MHHPLKWLGAANRKPIRDDGVTSGVRLRVRVRVEYTECASVDERSPSFTRRAGADAMSQTVGLISCLM